MTEAWAQQAEALYSLKRFAAAITRYDKVIELDPNRWGAYNDRGLAKFYSEDYYPAISDFSEALQVKKRNHLSDSPLDDTYDNRAEAYMKVRDYERAISDYGHAIGLHFSSAVFLMSLPQIREIYPEFEEISDADLLEGLREKFYPYMSSANFVSEYARNTKPYKEFVLAGLYESRGNAYLDGNNFRRAASEYKRAQNVDSDYEIDRWKLISSGSHDSTYLDIRSANFDDRRAVLLWIKNLPTTPTDYTVYRYLFNCISQKMKLVRFVKYHLSGAVKESDGDEGSWQLIVPDSIGERLINGACSR